VEVGMKSVMSRAAVFAAAMVVGGITAVVAAQGTRTPQSDDTLSQLLTEVRGLRAALEQMATAGARVQLVLGRVQLQEQRIENQARRLDVARAALRAAQTDLVSMQQQAKELQQTVQNFPNSQNRAQAEAELEMVKAAIARKAEEVQRLSADESMLVQDVTAEQNRWSDFNQRLDELERMLNRR
jgi:chromosome segregation ATPase